MGEIDFCWGDENLVQMQSTKAGGWGTGGGLGGFFTGRGMSNFLHAAIGRGHV